MVDFTEIRGPHTTPIPMEEAIHIATAEAKKWDADAQLQFVTSQDTDQDLADYGKQASDGKRLAWGFQFKNPQTHKMLVIEIRDKQVLDVMEAGTDSSPAIDVSDIHFTSSGLVRAAKQVGVHPTNKRPVGYHFVLTYSAHFGHVVQVLGVDEQGVRNSLLFDPRTGEQLPARWVKK